MAAQASKKVVDAEAETDGTRIRQLKVGAFVTLSPALTKGALQARKLASEQVIFYWRHTCNNKTVRLLIGPYDSSRPPSSTSPSDVGKFSIKAAAAQANKLAGDVGSVPVLPSSSESFETPGNSPHAPADESTEETPSTLADLLNSYVSSLEQSGRSSWKEVRNALNRHVLEKFPQLVNQAAHTITTKQLVGVLRPIHMSGKGRQGNKIRSYLRAAFERALSAENNPAEDQELTGYKITSNPVSAIAANTHLNRSAKNPLNKAELIKYWQLIKNEPGVRGLALRLHLLSGSPRPAQLIRLKPADICAEHIRLKDCKGRPGGPTREHVLPLTQTTQKIALELASLRTETGKPYVLSTTHGRKPICSSTMTNWAAEVVGNEISGFQLKRVRSGVETLFASLGVSEEVRGHLQSHGISGLQNKHYNGHKYFNEKLDALNLLFDVLEQKKKRSRRK